MTPQKLIALVASAFGLTAEDLTGRSRRRYLVEARQAAAWVLRRAYPAISLEEIGRLLGHRDHTTIIYSLEQVEQRIAGDVQLRAQLHSLVPEHPTQPSPDRGGYGRGMRWWAAQSRDSFFVRAA